MARSDIILTNNETNQKQQFDELICQMKDQIKDKPELFNLQYEDDKTISLAFKMTDKEWENGLILINKEERYLTFSSDRLLGAVDTKVDEITFKEDIKQFDELFSEGMAIADHLNLSYQEVMDAGGQEAYDAKMKELADYEDEVYNEHSDERLKRDENVRIADFIGKYEESELGKVKTDFTRIAFDALVDDIKEDVKNHPEFIKSAKQDTMSDVLGFESFNFTNGGASIRINQTRGLLMYSTSSGHTRHVEANKPHSFYKDARVFEAFYHESKSLWTQSLSLKENLNSIKVNEQVQGNTKPKQQKLNTMRR